MPNSVSIGFGPLMINHLKDDSNDTPQALETHLWVERFRCNHLDEPIFIAGTKPLSFGHTQSIVDPKLILGVTFTKLLYW